MEKKLNPIPSPLPGRGLKRDFERLREHGGATAGELRNFVRQLKGRSTQEVLGLVAQSGLVRATALATAVSVVLILALTLVPFALAKLSPPEQPTAATPAATTSGQPAADQPAVADQPADAAAAAAAAGDEQPPAAGGADQPQASEDLLDALGEGDTLETNPDSNPLEDSREDLLDDLQ